MRYICEGHEYRYIEYRTEGVLVDNYGTNVAYIELAGVADEYHYAVDANDGEQALSSIHENALTDTMAARGRWLVEAYVAHTS